VRSFSASAELLASSFDLRACGEKNRLPQCPDCPDMPFMARITPRPGVGLNRDGRHSDQLATI
jgi:hypothetical protein